MYKIENAQRELCEYLISIMPVEWNKICFHSECDIGYRSTWIAMVEKNTGVICTQEFFWERYISYPCKKMEANIQLNELTRNLFNTYLEKFGKEKIWKCCYLTINEDYSFKFEFEYELPEGNLVEQHDAIFERFFGVPYKYVKEKYPY